MRIELVVLPDILSQRHALSTGSPTTGSIIKKSLSFRGRLEGQDIEEQPERHYVQDRSTLEFRVSNCVLGQHLRSGMNCSKRLTLSRLLPVRLSER